MRWLRNKGESCKVSKKYGQALAIKPWGGLPSKNPRAGWGYPYPCNTCKPETSFFTGSSGVQSIIIQNRPVILWKLFRSWHVTTPDHKIHHAGETNGQCLALWNAVRQKLYLSLLELTDPPCSFRLAHWCTSSIYYNPSGWSPLEQISCYSSLRISGFVDGFRTLWTYIRRKAPFEMLNSSILYP